MISQLHQLLLELIPGGAKKDLSAAQAKALLACARSAASRSCPAASTRPPGRAMRDRASSSRGRELAISAGIAASHRCTVAPSPRRKKSASKCRSISRAAQTGSPAASACRIASSVSPCSSCQAAALRCSCAAWPGCSSWSQEHAAPAGPPR